MARVAFDAVPFTTKNGHVLNPGDPCIAVTVSRHIANLIHGRYLGTRKNRYCNDVNVVIDRDKFVSRLVHNVTGEEYDHDLESKELPYSRMDYTHRYPSPKYIAAQEEYNRLWKVVIEDRKVRQADYSMKKFPVVRRTTLQLNKVYPADIALKDVTL